MLICIAEDAGCSIAGLGIFQAFLKTADLKKEKYVNTIYTN